VAVDTSGAMISVRNKIASEMPVPESLSGRLLTTVIVWRLSSPGAPICGFPIQSTSPGLVLALHAMFAEHLQERRSIQSNQTIQVIKTSMKEVKFF
jgi:hypothetical protein